MEGSKAITNQPQPPKGFDSALAKMLLYTNQPGQGLYLTRSIRYKYQTSYLMGEQIYTKDMY